jgi:hypothetical protein
MDVIDAIHSRRSIRSYQSNLVDRDLIKSVIWDAAQAPPPFSGQVPWTGLPGDWGCVRRCDSFASDF